MVSLIFGLLALGCNILALLPAVVPNLSTGFLAFVGFVLAIVAVATGNGILRSDRTDKAARAGKAIGTVCIVLAVLAIILFLMAILGVIVGGMALARGCAG
ncbi:MAG TPA: hypothetical protein DEB31_09420 [Clostridiales bacterium]|nr:hypothetical protein [Clostridiales bacterium]